VLLVSLVPATRADLLAVQKAAEKRAEQPLSDLADEAYRYGYPLVLLDETFRVATNVTAPQNHRAPVNQFARLTNMPDEEFREVVLPNVDTLYTSAFLDLSMEPVVLHIPDMMGRYYLMAMLDAYTNVFAAPGKRTMGPGELKLAIAGPNFDGPLPAGLRIVKAPTDRVWLIGRTQIKGEDDWLKAVELVRAYTLTPLSAWGTDYIPPPNVNVDPKLDMGTAPSKRVGRLGDRAYFERLAALLALYPPPSADAALLARFEQLGLAPGRFEPSLAAAKAIQGAGARAAKQMRARAEQIGELSHGWRVVRGTGSYGTRYDDRAAIALLDLGAILSADAIHPATAVDGEGVPLNGRRDAYVIHFEKGQEPPANAFWSMTMYDKDGYLVDNPVHRFALGDRDKLLRNPDGSLDLLIQHEPPAGRLIANWLPAPAAPFQLLMRVYWPRQEMISGSWQPPPVQRSRVQQAASAAEPDR
jgi:hypothetical protein